MDLIDIFRTFYLKPAEQTFFSSAHRTVSRRDHILRHKLSLGKFRKTEITSSIVSKHNTVRLEINYEGKSAKNTDTWRLNNKLIQGYWRSQRGKQTYLETKENENTSIQNLWDAAKMVLRAKFTAIQSHLMKQEISRSSRRGSVVNESDWEPWGCGFGPWPCSVG